MTTTGFPSLPTELITEIASHTDNRSLLQLIMCNSFLSTLLTPTLHTRALAPHGPRTAMQWAADRAHISLIKHLLARGVHPDDGAPIPEPTPVQLSVTHEQSPALLSAVLHSRTDIAELLCSHGADVNRQNRGSMVCLQSVVHVAAVNGDSAMIALLASHGADVASENLYGTYVGSPLHQAVLSSDVESVRVLLEMDVAVHTVDSAYLTPVEVAEMVASEDTDTEEWFETTVTIAKMLMRKGAGIRYADEESLAELKARPSDEKTVRFYRRLIEFKAELDKE